jgi:integrase
MGVDVKIAQELLRHANSRTTLDIYTRAVSAQKRDANAQIVQMLLQDGIKGFSTYAGNRREKRLRQTI